MGTGRTICGTIVAGSNPDAVVSWISPSPDGRILALGVCADGSENNLIHLIDVDSGELLESPHQTLMDAWTGGAHWLADSSGFFFSALEGEADKFKQAIFFHGIGKTPPSTAEAIPYPDDTRDYRVVTVSACGRWAVAAYRMIQTIPIAICDLSSSKGEWHPFVTVPDVPVYGHVAGDRYVAITFVNAPRGRIVAIPLDAADANDTECWHELVPESDAVLRSLTPVEDCIYVTEIVDTYSRIRIFGVDGFCRGELPLPSKGGLDEMHFPLMELVRSTPRSEFLFPFSSPAQSWSLLRHNRSAARVETISPPALDLNSLNIEDRSARASDGTLLPYQLIRSPGADATGPQPTVVYAYASASRCSLNSLDRWERWSSWGQM
jgi:prolyl oligopeptidase